MSRSRKRQRASNLKEKRELVELGPKVKVFLPDIEGLKVSQGVLERDSYFLRLSKPGQILTIWLDIAGGLEEITIGDKDYRVKGDKLVELAKMGIFDLIRREIKSREFPLMMGENGEIVINLKRIEGNDKLKEFLG